jgi:hypothetical protein
MKCSLEVQEKSGDERRGSVAQTVSNWNQIVRGLQEINLLRGEGFFRAA